MEFGFYVAMEESVACYSFIYDVAIEQRQDASEAVAGYQELGSHYLVAQLQGFAQQGPVVVDGEQSTVGGVARIEQTGVYLAVTLAEIIAQHTVIEQQLYVVVLALQSVGIVTLVLYLHVLARLLLYQQTHVGGHQVYPTLQS